MSYPGQETTGLYPNVIFKTRFPAKVDYYRIYWQKPIWTILLELYYTYNFKWPKENTHIQANLRSFNKYSITHQIFIEWRRHTPHSLPPKMVPRFDHTKEYIRLAIKYMKRYSISLIIRERQIKTTVRFHYNGKN